MHAPAKPRVLSPRARARLVWLAVHRWIGIILLLVFVATGLTGMALVWPKATEQLFHPDRFPAQPAETAVSTDMLLDAARAALPEGSRITGISLAAPGEAALVTGEPGGPPNFGIGPPRRPRIWLDPADGSVLAASNGDPDVLFFAKAVHGHLFVPGTGRLLVALTGLFLVASAVSGFWLWWPGMRNITAAFKWRRPFSRSMNLHRTIGPLVGIGLIAQGLTGILIAQPAILGLFVGTDEAGQGGGPRGPAPRPLDAPALSAAAAIEAAVGVAGGIPGALTLPTETSPWSVNLDNGAVVTVDDRTGSAVRISPPAPDPTLAAREAMVEIHGGGYGSVHRVLLFATGLAFVTLSITGLFLWLQGRRRQKR